MLKKPFSFRRKSSDERSQRRESDSHSPHSSLRSSIASINESDDAPLASTETDSQASGPRKSSKVEEPLGLNVIYTPEHGRHVDIVFIHGLGGTSRLSWSKHKNLNLFWPLTFLPREPDLCQARILTFGYNASIHRAGNVGTSVLDFAKDLLFDLKYAQDEQKEELNMGDVPIIFVVHSMGGLVVKEAYMQGQNDPEYESIVKAVSAITFLSTPHRGSNLAETLNRILQSSFFTNSKQYISELSKNSLTLQKLNEQFRHIAPKLDIVSFYETQPTSVGLKNARVMVLERDSSVLGYPGETSKPLDADHHAVCKYQSPEDPNYVTVRNALKSLVSKIISTSVLKPPGPSTMTTVSSRVKVQDLKSFLAITDLPDTDYVFFRDQWTPGTSEWILEHNTYLDWFDDRELTPRALWLHGGAATGKSVLSSFIINSLVEQGCHCQYFFIRFGDQKKRRLVTLLRSLAFQMAQILPDLCQRIIQLADEAFDFEAADARTVWERIFKSILFDLNTNKPFYWVIDGLEEADDPRAVVRLLSEVSSSSISLRILFVSRKSPELESALHKLPQRLTLGIMNIEENSDDIRSYVQQELDIAGSLQLKENVVQRLIGGAQNNFLWVRLAVEKLNSCHTQADVELALQHLPLGMRALYDRMAQSIVENSSSTDKALATAILQVVICSLRVLRLAELVEVLDEHTSQVLDFQRAIVELCGGFVVIDNDGKVTTIHQTAREYLLSHERYLERPFHVSASAAHEQMFLSCMRCLMSVGLRAKVNPNQKPELLDYAADAWSSHLLASPKEGHAIDVLQKFLTGHSVLTWIQVIAANKQLRVLVRASKHLSKYSNGHKVWDAQHNPTEQRILEQYLIDGWATDLVKIVGKFGVNLQRSPELIQRLIPPFCPKSSAIYQQFGKKEARSLMVSGFSDDVWDDSLARISLRSGTYASSLVASGNRVSIMNSTAAVSIYDSSTFEEVALIKHGERVYMMVMSSTGTLLATYGYRTTKIWEISTGDCKVTVGNPESRPRPLTLLFTRNNGALLVGTDDKWISSLDLNQPTPVWQHLVELEEPELDGHFLNAPSCMSLNSDGGLVAVAYRGHPLSAWETDGPEHIGHCWRTREVVARGEVIQATWHPYSEEVLGLYIEGVVFKWRPYDDETLEIATGASRLAISSNGALFVTGDVNGTVKVFNTADLHLLYQLPSQDNVLGVAFGPEMHRFYDIRGSYGSVWEPTALMKFAEQTEKGSDSGSEIESLPHLPAMSPSRPRRVDSITVLVASPAGRFYCYGTEEGIVHLYEVQRGKIADLYSSKGFMSIEQLTWSNDGRYLCFSDSNKKVVIISITSGTSALNTAAQSKVEISVKTETKGPILELLIHPASSHLLVCTSSTLSVISLASFSVTQSSDWPSTGCKWIIHPQNSALVLGVRPGAIHALDWNLVEQYSFAFDYSFQSAAPIPDTPGDGVVERVLLTHDERHLLVQLSIPRQISKGKALLLFDASLFSSTGAPITQESTTRRAPVMLPIDVSSQVLSILSCLPHNRLIYLSRDFSICSLQLFSGSNYMSAPSKSSTSDKIKQLFALPGDWISRDCLALCSIWPAERSLLCPRNGEVAVVRSAALA